MAQGMVGQIMRNRTMQLQNEAGMPQPMAGVFLAPFRCPGGRHARADRGPPGLLTGSPIK